MNTPGITITAANTPVRELAIPQSLSRLSGKLNTLQGMAEKLHERLELVCHLSESKKEPPNQLKQITDGALNPPLAHTIDQQSRCVDTVTELLDDLLTRLEV